MPKILHVFMCAMVVSLVAGSPAFALFETNKELIQNARITMQEAVKSAITVIPGRAVEADLGKEDGRTVWKVEVIDATNKSRTVYIDAQTGEARRDK